MDSNEVYRVVVELKRDIEKVDAHHARAIAGLETRLIDRLNAMEVRIADLERRMREKR
jgi:hypothetical protein